MESRSGRKLSRHSLPAPQVLLCARLQALGVRHLPAPGPTFHPSSLVTMHQF